MVKRHTTASCFATYMLAHVLFVADFEERERIARGMLTSSPSKNKARVFSM